MSNYYLNSLKYASNFYRKSVSIYKVHSPYLYAFIEDTMNSKKHHYSFSAIEILRKKLLKNSHSIEMVDYGAGSRLDTSTSRKISEIAKTSLSPTAQCQSMFWMINRLQPQYVIELGSSLGISTMYLGMANSKTQILSLEGNPDSLNIARQLADQLHLKNIKFIEGNFDDTLQNTLDSLPTIDMAFIDGNHQYHATIDYFEMLLQKINDKSVLIFDDIYWSPGMKKAWEEVKSHPSVRASLDLYTYGILFFDPVFEESKHIKLLSVWYKPWQFLNL